MNLSTKKKTAFALFAVATIVAALFVRSSVQSRYERTQRDLVKYRKRQAIRLQMETVARQNESLLATQRAAVTANPNDIKARWALVGNLQKFKMLKEALPELEVIRRLDPQSFEASIAVANTRLALGQLPEAEAAYRSVTKNRPDKIEGWEGLGTVLYHQKKYRQAGEAARQALKIDPKDAGTRLVVASSALEYALEFPDEHDIQDPLHIAQTLFTDLLKENPDSGELEYQLGLTYFLLHEKSSALPHLERAAQLLPDRKNIAFDYAQIFISAGQSTKVRPFLLEKIAQMPKAAGFYNLLAESLQYENDPKSIQQSLNASKKAVELSPNTVRYWDRLGTDYLRAKDLKQARAAYEKSLLLDPNRAHPYQQLAGILTRLGDTKRAGAAASMAVKMVTNEESLQHIEALSAQYPDDTNLLLTRADRYRDLKMNNPARDLYERILAIEPTNKAAQIGIERLNKNISPNESVQ